MKLLSEPAWVCTRMSGSKNMRCASSGKSSVAAVSASAIPHAPGAAQISAAAVASTSRETVMPWATRLGSCRIAWMLWQRDAMSEASRLWK